MTEFEQEAGEPATLVVVLSYDGEAFNGFAKQKDESLRTVQGCLEKALGILFGHEVQTVCAGRTDAGVHALGQVVSASLFESDLKGRESRKIVTSLNALTDDDIAVTGAFRATDHEFSARFDAQWREYRYRMVFGGAPALFMRKYAWWNRTPLDVEAMSEAAACLVGEHDFKSFCKKQSAIDKNTVREIRSIEFFWEEQMGEKCLCLRIVGNAFLHSMIRTIVGTLAEVGSGRKDPAWVKEVLEACDRDRAGQNAPACGLVFHEVTYASDSWRLVEHQ